MGEALRRILAIVLSLMALSFAQAPPTNLTVVSQPDSPVGLTLGGDVLAAQAGQVLVQWLPDSFADAGFNVYRAESVDGPWTQLNATPIPDTFIWDDPPRQATTYYYAVFEVHADGSQNQAAAIIGASLP